MAQSGVDPGFSEPARTKHGPHSEGPLESGIPFAHPSGEHAVSPAGSPLDSRQSRSVGSPEGRCLLHTYKSSCYHIQHV